MPSGRLYLTPTMMRTGYHLRSATPAPPVDPALRPQLAAGRDPNTESDAFAEWLHHVDAGRIAVR